MTDKQLLKYVGKTVDFTYKPYKYDLYSYAITGVVVGAKKLEKQVKEDQYDFIIKIINYAIIKEPYCQIDDSELELARNYLEIKHVQVKNISNLKEVDQDEN